MKRMPIDPETVDTALETATHASALPDLDAKVDDHVRGGKAAAKPKLVPDPVHP